MLLVKSPNVMKGYLGSPEQTAEVLHDGPKQVFAVTALPDEKKRERITVVHTLSGERLVPVLEKLSQCDFPALWKPQTNQFFHVDELSLLGTRKN